MRDIFILKRSCFSLILLLLCGWFFILLPASADNIVESNPITSDTPTNTIIESPAKDDDSATLDLVQPPVGERQSAVPEIPVPPAVALPDLGHSMIVKDPLTWRAKATAMSVEYPFNEKNSACWLLPIAYDKGQMLLKQAINQSGLEIVGEYPDAGQYLLHTQLIEMKVTENNNVGADVIRPREPEIIIVSQPVSETKTLFKLRIYSNTKMATNKRIYAIPAIMQSLLGNRGLLQ